MFSNYLEEKNKSKEICTGIASAYPPLLQQELLKKIDKFFADKKGLSLYLPFWLRDVMAINTDILTGVIASNFFGLSYFLVVDHLMDADPVESGFSAERMPLTTLLFSDFISFYQRLFMPDALFWTDFRKYLNEWAEKVTLEKCRQLPPAMYDQDAVGEDPPLWGESLSEIGKKFMAGKSAPIKIPAAALCHYNKKAELIADLETIIDLITLSIQMLDDYKDWQEDLEAGNYTYFLSKVTTLGSCEHGKEPEGAKEVAWSIIMETKADDYLEELTVYCREVEEMAGYMNLQGAISFANMLAKASEKQKEFLDKKRLELSQGKLFWAGDFSKKGHA